MFERQVIQPTNFWIESRGDFAMGKHLNWRKHSTEWGANIVNKVVELKGGINNTLHHYSCKTKQNYIEVTANIFETDIQKELQLSTSVVIFTPVNYSNNLNAKNPGSNPEGNIMVPGTHNDRHMSIPYKLRSSTCSLGCQMNYYKGIMADHQEQFHGKIFVRQDAQQNKCLFSSAK